ncbi:hypothetical protein Tco_0880291 [Tanacetum coccineum]
MAALESCPKHNMVAYLEKTDGNAEFHEVIDFLKRSYIHHALTVSPVVSTTFIEQFWNSAKSKIVDNVRYINAKVAGKPVTISEASIRSSLLFDDADGIDSLNNQAIFDAIQTMGYEGDLTVLTFNKALFSPQWRFLFHIMNHCISSKSTSWDQIPTNIATAVICLTTHKKYNFSKLIFDGMLRHLDAKKKFVMYPRFISIFISTQLKGVPVPVDHFPVPALTSKVFSFMVKKGKHFSGKITPLFPSMLVQPTKAEGEGSDRPSAQQPTPSPPHLSEAPDEPHPGPSPQPTPSPPYPSEAPDEPQPGPSPQPTPSPPHQPADLHESMPDPIPSPITPIPNSIPQGDVGKTSNQSSNDKSLSRSQALKIKALKAQVKKLKKRTRPGRKVVKSSKGEPFAHKDPAFEAFDDIKTLNEFEDPLDDAMDYLRTKEIKDDVSTDLHQGTEKEKVSTNIQEVSTDRERVSTDTQKVSTDKAREGTDAQKVSTDTQEVSTDSTKLSTDKDKEGTDEPGDEQTPTLTTPTTTTATLKVLLNMSQARAVTRENEKGVELRDVEEGERPRPSTTVSVLTLKPLLKINPKDKGKKRIEEDDESGTEVDEITTVEKKFKQLNADEELTRKIQEDWEIEEEKKRLVEEEAINDALVQELDDVKARIEADRLLALRLQEEEREQFTIEERAKFLHDTIAAQRRFLAEQRSAAIRSKPPTKTQLRNQMITYLKHVGRKKHADLKSRKFEDIQALYERIKRSNDRFLHGLLRGVQKITKKKDDQESLKDKESAEVPAEADVTEQGTKKRKGGRIKMIAKKRSRPQQGDNDDDDELKLCLVITPDEDKEVDYEILNRKYPIIEWRSEFLTTKTQFDKSKEIEEINLNVVTRSNGKRRYFSTLMRILSIVDREDLNAIYHLVMDKYLNDTPEGFDRILWGDLMTMFNQGVYTLMTETGLVIHMLVENKYPLKEEVLSQMLKLKLETEEDSTMALELIRKDDAEKSCCVAKKKDCRSRMIAEKSKHKFIKDKDLTRVFEYILQDVQEKTNEET